MVNGFHQSMDYSKKKIIRFLNETIFARLYLSHSSLKGFQIRKIQSLFFWSWKLPWYRYEISISLMITNHYQKIYEADNMRSGPKFLSPKSIYR
jgi:hypothetical protein